MILSFVLGAGTALAVAALAVLIFQALTVSVEDEAVVLVTRWGKLVRKLETPGLHFLPSRLLPWVRRRAVSLRRGFRHLDGIAVNDARGTTAIVDVFVEFRIVDPERAAFRVADWERSMTDVVEHSLSAILAGLELDAILRDRHEIGAALQRDIEPETRAWGMKVELALVRDVKVTRDVARQMAEGVAARLERAKADVDEAGRQRAAQLEAETTERIAGLVAEAKGQYPSAIGRALAALRDRPRLLAAYNELYELSLLRPHRTVAFDGFEPGDLRAADAAMLVPSDGLRSS